MHATVQVLGTGLPPSLRALVDQYQSRRTQTAADRSLARRFHAALQTAETGVTGLAVYVHNGAISLYGSAPTEAAREALVALAAAQPGVRRIVDHLQVGDA